MAVAVQQTYVKGWSTHEISDLKYKMKQDGWTVKGRRGDYLYFEKRKLDNAPPGYSRFPGGSKAGGWDES
jgi:hypothetical protein